MPWRPPRPTPCPRCGPTGVRPPWTSCCASRPSRAGCRWPDPGRRESTALGAATLAGLAEGVWGSLDELAGLWSASARFEPELPVELTDALYAVWQRAVERARGWAGRNPGEPETAAVRNRGAPGSRVSGEK